jgi:outer membrane receptor protein involved in Fe transport
LALSGLTGLAALLALVLSASAQTQPAPTAAPPADSETVNLSQFLVTESDDSYEANNTTGVTGTNREISRMPISMNVATNAFLKDINARSILDAIEMTPNVGLTFPDANDGGSGAQDSYRLRGLTSKEERRQNGVISLMPSDSFATDRIEFVRGAQTLLYGQGIATGVVNIVTKRAALSRSFTDLTANFDSEGSTRYTIDTNQSYKNKVAIRIVAVDAYKKYWQKNLNDDTQGLYFDFAYRLTKNITARVNQEHLKGVSQLRGGQLTLRDNSLKDTRNGVTLDTLLYNKRDVSGITLAGEGLSYETYRSPSSMTNGRDSKAQVTNVSLEGAFGRNLSARVSYSWEVMHYLNESNGVSDLLSPNDNRAVNGQWSYTVDPTRSDLTWHLQTFQGTVVHKSQFGSFLKNELILGVEDRYRSQTIERQRLYAVDGNGALIPGTDALGMKQLVSYVVPVSLAYPQKVRSVPGYIWRTTHAYGVVAPTPTNPRGLGGVGTPLNTPQWEQAIYGNWLGTWFDGRLETLSGIRFDHIRQEDKVLATVDYNHTRPSGLVGVVYNLNHTRKGNYNVALYGNVGKSFSATPATRLQIFDLQDWPTASGKTVEGGVKFDAFGDRLSGTVAYYNNKNHGEIIAGSTAQQDLYNPAGINGRSTSVGTTATMYAQAQGVEFSITMKPAKGWRVMVTAGTNDAKTISPATSVQYYNDQFNTDGTTVLVKAADGSTTPLLVPSIRTDTTSAKIPLTIAMMKDPSSAYFATLDPTSGLITNANNLFLNTTGVKTNVNGLPISAHQLGFKPASDRITVIGAGDYLTPVAGRSALFNTTYTFSNGYLKGLSVGGLYSWTGKYRMGYAVIGGTRQLYYADDSYRADARMSYRLNLRDKRFVNLQFTCSNFTDKQVLLPTLNVTNGVLTSVTIAQAPRTYNLTATLHF